MSPTSSVAEARHGLGRITTPADLRAVTGAPFTVSDQQWEAISALPEPGVVIAGAGSGKTELMSARVIYLVANGFVRPDQVLGLTFTTKATAELATRIRSALARAGLDRAAEGPDGEQGEVLEPVVSTYNAYASSLLVEHGLRIAHEPDVRVMGDAERFQLAQRVVAEHRGEVRHLSDHPASVIGHLLALDGAMAEHLVDAGAVRAFQSGERGIWAAELADLANQKKTLTKQRKVAAVLQKMDERRELLDLVTAYREAKQRLRLMDFSDQIVGACRIAETFPDVCASERERFRVVLLDEYQDTSVAQALLLSRLFSGPDAEHGRGHAVTAVGDPNQAIYGWRGASVANITGFREQFPLADGQPSHRFSLTVNRRSDSRILEVANVLAAPLLQEQAGLVDPLEAKPGAEPGVVRSAVLRTAEEEMEWLVKEVVAAHDRIAATALETARAMKIDGRFDQAREAEQKAGACWREIGVLVRTNTDGARAHEALSAAGVPVEIVGLGGLLHLPEVAQVVATLSLLEDLSDNASLLTLLTGPRWEIGVRDLALLGRRSAEMAQGVRIDGDELSISQQLSESVTGADPTELASLNEALVSPGDLPYSTQALERFRHLADELEYLRSFVSDPIAELVRKVVDVIGLDVELASSISPSAQARRENLDLFLHTVATFRAVDGAVSLAALNAWLRVQASVGTGLELAPPTESDSVKLLTVHRSKGLEYDVVFMFGVAAGQFPSDRPRLQWTASASELPSPLRGDAASVPQVEERSAEGLDSFKIDVRAHHDMEERRLGYVAYTRARHEFVVSAHVWDERKKPLAPSEYLLLVRELEERWGTDLHLWYELEEDETNPVTAATSETAWPAMHRSAERIHREQAALAVLSADPSLPDDADALAAEVSESGESSAETVARWDSEIARLVEEERLRRTRRPVVEVPLSLSTTALQRLRNDPETFAEELLRPMPRPPAPAAKYGTLFHAWVEARFEQQGLIEPEDLPGRGDDGIEDDTDLRVLQDAFERGPFSESAPLAVEAPFSLSLGAHVVRGRIDAVYRRDPAEDGSERFLVVDWKTNRAETADPFQLSVYRQAWAELNGVPPENVEAVFHYVRSGRTVSVDAPSSRDDLTAVLDAADAPESTSAGNNSPEQG